MCCPKFSLKAFLSVFSLILFIALPCQSFAIDPVHVNISLQGCKNTGQIPLYLSNYICDDSVYTPGNLGKGWNELDLVPYRVSTTLGKQSTATTTYSIAIMLDNLDNAHPGFDVISVPTVNTAESDASCAVSAAPNTGAGAILIPGIGGTDQSIYRIITITQDKGTTCVLDYYGRLALGSHLYPGSSLHANLTLADFTTGNIGAQDVSIPVNNISAQTLAKDMTAVQAADFIWSVTKQGSTTLHFGDVCAADVLLSKPVDISVVWTKGAVAACNTSVITHVYATNPAARPITISGNDKIYKGLTQTTLLSTTAFGPTVLAAGASQMLVLTDNQSFSPANSSDGYFNDIATANYVDTATGITIPTTTTDVASAQITANSSSNATATVSDTESITGTGLNFAVAAPSVGAFTGGYVANTLTVGPVNWSVLNLNASGSVTFNKTITLAPFTVTSGSISDTATLTTAGGSTSTANFKINMDSSAATKITINKTLPFALNAGEKIKMIFSVAGSGAPVTQELDIVGPYTAGTTVSVDVNNLAPDNYSVSETDCKFINAANPDPGIACNLAPNNSSVNVDLSLVKGVATCSGKADFTNVIAQSPSAEVVKVTDPSCDPNNKSAYTWNFTLTGPNNYSNTVSANSCDGGVSFGNLADGNYVMTETLRSGWNLSQITQPDGNVVTQNACQFAVHVATDGGKVFTCTFKNTSSGAISVKKSVKKSTSFMQSFSFDVRTGAQAGVPGTVVRGPSVLTQANNPMSFTNLPAGNYQLCETGLVPGWNVNFAGYTKFNPSINPNDNSTQCVNVVVTAGGTLTVNVDNTPPPGGKSCSTGYWKDWCSCSYTDNNHSYVLDKTLATFSIAYGKKTHGCYVGTLYVDTCKKAVSCLTKTTLTGASMNNDPLFMLAAELLAAKLNIQSAAASCTAAANAVSSAQALLNKYRFNGSTHTAMSAADIKLANTLTTLLNNFNNNTLPGCSK